MTTDWVPLGLGTYNTHMGRTLVGDQGGDLGWLLRTFPSVTIWALQEAPSRRSIIRALRRAGLRRRWRVLSPEKVRPGHPHMIVKRSRFKVLQVRGPWMWSPQHARARLTAVLKDRRTGRLVAAANVHVDPLGQGIEHALRGHLGKPMIPHERQVATHVRWLAKWSSKDLPEDKAAVAREAVVTALGDVNESLGEPVQQADSEMGRRTVTQRFEAAGLKPAHRLTPAGSREVRLDDVFLRDDDFVRVESRSFVETPSPDADHIAVVTRVKVKPLDTGTGSA